MAGITTQSQFNPAFNSPADIRNEDKVKKVVAQTVKKFGKLDILINNAGIFPKIKQLHEIDEFEWNEVLDEGISKGSYKKRG